jgi:hypothetical protein
MMRSNWAETASADGWAKMVRMAAATISALALGTLANTLRMQWISCRIRHEVHYAEQRIMPIWRRQPLWGKGFVFLKSA